LVFGLQVRRNCVLLMCQALANLNFIVKDSIKWTLRISTVNRYFNWEMEATLIPQAYIHYKISFASNMKPFESKMQQCPWGLLLQGFAYAVLMNLLHSLHWSKILFTKAWSICSPSRSRLIWISKVLWFQTLLQVQGVLVNKSTISKGILQVYRQSQSW
jgi:hypothetical protein